LLVLLVVARALLVLSLSDVFYFGEEMGKGAAAKAMLDHLGVEHYKLAYGYHEGGGFVVTHLKAVAFLLVGESALAHKLVALFTTSVLLAVGWWFTREHFGRAASWIFGLLFVFCPASFQRFSLLDLGTHFEAMIFIVLVLHFAFRIAFADGDDAREASALSQQPGTLVQQPGTLAQQPGTLAQQPSARAQRFRDHVGLGLSAGFGTYFSLQCLPAIACAGVCLLVAERQRIFNRFSTVALAAFAVGAAPLWWMMSKVGLAAIIVRGHEIGQGTGLAEGLRDLFEPIVRHGDALDWLVLATYPLAIGLGIVVLWSASRKSTTERSGVRTSEQSSSSETEGVSSSTTEHASSSETERGSSTTERVSTCATERIGSRAIERSVGELDPKRMTRKALVVVAYMVLYLSLYLASGLAVGVEGHWFGLLRLSAVWLMGIVLIAAAASTLLAHAAPILRASGVAALGLLLGSGVLDLFFVMGEGQPNAFAANARRVATTKGYLYSEYLDKFVHHLDATEEQKIAVLRHYRDDPALLYPSINHSLFEHSTLPLDDVLAISRRAYGDRWLESLKGLGPYLRTTSGYDLAAELVAIARAPVETQEALVEAAGRTGLGLKITPERIEEEIRYPVPASWRPAFLRGTGWRIHQFYKLRSDLAHEEIARASPEDQVVLRAGFDSAVALDTLKR
jgi:hypothetical protein